MIDELKVGLKKMVNKVHPNHSGETPLKSGVKSPHNATHDQMK
jgi:hypothetical protein